VSDDRKIRGEAAEVLERLFVGEEVESRDLVSAASRAQTDDEVRALYDRLALTDRKLGGDFEERVGEAWFLDSLDTMLAEEQADNVVSLDAHRTRRPIGALIASAALVMFGIVGVLTSQSRRSAPEFQARSAAAPDVSPYESPNFEVFCVERDGGDVSFRGRAESEFATVRCPVGAEIKFAVSNPDPDLRHVALFGIASDHTLYWYGPSPAAPAEVTIERSEKLQPIGETIRLQVNHEPGTVRVVGLFTERPMEYRDVELFVRSNIYRLRDGTLTIDGGTVVRQTFEVSGP
jgi:hypothetical protein